ncbi:putative pyruvate formate lyase activating enzyme [Pseudobutyrivibrio sp. 49]|uniref:radical SAM protein n=1 Tax=unclassified Pseudobutyrivibrio TaxID=2638619 RepID=UPI000884FC92|nr:MULTISPECIES: radical SAM protein [unclassified Pseudobutyrivibrio]SDH34907.1 putative pyruvate formate lyase activating enzyme [Pseudobutyrivibrio sp. 49]SFN48154.1 putative pyruvate formate lyase activating enzyme [Pseudobutyrivibrio sp. UC1225]
MNKKCTLCPRNCGVDRDEALGVCQVSSTVKVARAALHFWEEPCISGENGSGAVFFSGCPLHCVFCQNEEISHGKVGKEITTEELANIYLDLQRQGANNINLVTGTHYIPSIVESVKIARDKGLQIPIIYNTSGYETEESLKLLDGIVNAYLPDFKYWDDVLASQYSHAKDYPDVVKSAIVEMVRQVGEPKFNEDGFIQSGVIVRQLLLPGHTKDSKAILKYLYETYGNRIYVSLMSQYTPMPHIAEKYPELNRRVTKREYEAVVDYALNLGIENAFIQDRKVAKESFIPKFGNEII